MIWLPVYNFFIQLYVAGIRIAALWNPKAEEWINGRKNLFEKLEKKIAPGDRFIWFHCASAGELEQAKPVMELIKKQYPGYRLLVSVFSPSGYRAAKKYAICDIITYMPADTRRNATRFIDITRPDLIIFIKYEFWYHHMAMAAFHHIPILLVSAIFRKEQIFFRKYGKFFRQMLFFFREIFVQDQASKDLLQQWNVSQVIVAGDTRFDRVVRIAGQLIPIPAIGKFLNGSPCIIAGSTWKEDEESLKSYSIMTDRPVKIIIAPHEIHEAHLVEIRALFPTAAFFSQLDDSHDTSRCDVLIIDNMGMLSRLYAYATICYIGGGFNKSGIHNTLEAAVYGKPVCFGPYYQKFREARDLVACGAACSFTGSEELKVILNEWLNDPEKLKAAGNAAESYVAGQTGATEKILKYIQENRLLTS